MMESTVPSERAPNQHAQALTVVTLPFNSSVRRSPLPPPCDKVPLLHFKRKIATLGTTFKDKNALLTGVGKGSIGVEILKGLLPGGAHVVITTSRYNRATAGHYQSIYQSFGARGSALTLTVVAFNQGSKQDVEALVNYIYATLGLGLDCILPFAAVPENDREIDGLDDKSELAHRIMLVSILGAVKNKKASRHFVSRPMQAILSLSPNHGLFGNVGLSSESKVSLETLFNRWNSESWGEYGPNALDFKVINGAEGEQDLEKLGGIIDLEKVVVITGFAEVSPWGSSRTHWEMEARGEFTIKGSIEMAWLMGHIKHFDGRLKDSSLYVGLVDSKTGGPVDGKDIRSRYKEEVLSYTGVQLIEPKLFCGYDPKKKVFN
ncbi:hypothetical protein EDB19DRAFT_1967461 [Suillus lakei]|nr:hypothetical protein EDB19DRAFT_1967461 [Suillus lakei]